MRKQGVLLGSFLYFSVNPGCFCRFFKLRFLSSKDGIDKKYIQKDAFEDLCQKISEKGDQKLQQFSKTCQELYAEKADPVTQAAVHMLLEATSKKYFLTLEKMRKLETEEEARTEKKSTADLDKLGEFFFNADKLAGVK